MIDFAGMNDHLFGREPEKHDETPGTFHQKQLEFNKDVLRRLDNLEKALGNLLLQLPLPPAMPHHQYMNTVSGFWGSNNTPHGYRR